MRNPSMKDGFTFVEVLLVLVVLAAIGFFGWYLYDMSQDSGTDDANTTATEQQAPTVESSEDLDAAEEFVENTDIDAELDTSELDAAFEE